VTALGLLLRPAYLKAQIANDPFNDSFHPSALGDFFADSLELGFGVSAGAIGGALAICAFLAYFTKVSHVVLFWIAFVLTRPFGATFGDLLTKGKENGGLDLGTWQASLVIFALFLVSFAYEMYDTRKKRKEHEKHLDEKLPEEERVF